MSGHGQGYFVTLVGRVEIWCDREVKLLRLSGRSSSWVDSFLLVFSI
jgi:hypothetical protein